MTILDQIQFDLAALTDAQIACAFHNQKPMLEGETVLGVLTNPGTRRLWALAFEYDRKSSQMLHNAVYEPDTGNRDTLKQEGRYFDALGDCTRSLAWVAIKQEFADAAWEAPGIGIREGGVIVAMTEEALCDLRGRVLGTASSLPELLAMGKRLAAQFGIVPDSEEEADAPSIVRPSHRRPPRKPQ